MNERRRAYRLDLLVSFFCDIESGEEEEQAIRRIALWNESVVDHVVVRGIAFVVQSDGTIHFECFLGSYNHIIILNLVVLVRTLVLLIKGLEMIRERIGAYTLPEAT